MSDYKFTQDWFKWAPPVWTQIKEQLPERKSFLEIGAFEGCSTVWTIENMMEDGGEIVAVDTWEGGEEHIGLDFISAEENFNSNILKVREKFPNRNVSKCKGLSTTWLPALAQDKRTFDFVYIDGSHIAKDVLTDACMAWPMLKPGGIMVFDDYMWGQARDILHRPKVAIDAFVNIFAEEAGVMLIGYQFIVRKNK